MIKRIKNPGIEIRDLPAVDLVLVTHAHFDHLDRRTLRAIASDQPIAVPEHVGSLVHGFGLTGSMSCALGKALNMARLKSR